MTGGSATFAEQAQIDGNFYLGAGMLAACGAAIMGTSDEQKKKVVVATVNAYRACGVSVSNVSDEKLVKDHIVTNIWAAKCLALASPSFYFMWNLTHSETLVTSLLRSVTGTVKIIPFTTALYGLLSLTIPLAMSTMFKEQDYEAAKGNSKIAMMVSGLASIEAMIELRGCGVTVMPTVGSFLIFYPALLGRLATGVLLQQGKVGTESTNILPDDFRAADAPEWKVSTNDLFDTLAIDQAFFVTLGGTTIFQHILNGVTLVLRDQGQGTTVKQIGKYIVGGMEGTAMSGANMLMRTFMLR